MSMTPRDPFLVLDALTATYGEARAVDPITLEVGRGELVALLGPSGCGKTTTLRMVAGFVEPAAGRVLIGGEDITRMPPHRRNMGVVFQSYALFPHLTVLENVAFGLRMRAMPAARAAREGAARRWSWSRCRISRSAIRRSSRAASSSAWRWRARW